MPLAFPTGRNRRGQGGAPSSGGTSGAAIGFGAVAAAAAFAVAVHKAARLRSPLGTSQWKAAVSEDGSCPSFEDLLQHISEKGLDPEVRPEVWPLLLGVYGAFETQEHRAVSYKHLRDGFEALLRRCQEHEAAYLEATSGRRSARSRNNSSCGATQQSASTATSATSSPAYPQSPTANSDAAAAVARCRPLASTLAGAATSTSGGGGDSRCCQPAFSDPEQLATLVSQANEDRSMEPATVADAAATASVGRWELGDEISALGSAGGRLPETSCGPFLGHISRTDVPARLRPYWEAQHAITLDAVRVDFKKTQLPGATPLAAATASGPAANAAPGGLMLSLRGLGFTGLGGGSGSGAAAAPSPSLLSPRASALPLCNSGGGSGGVANWLREKMEGYQASRAARQQQEQGGRWDQSRPGRETSRGPGRGEEQQRRSGAAGGEQGQGQVEEHELREFEAFPNEAVGDAGTEPATAVPESAAATSAAESGEASAKREHQQHRSMPEGHGQHGQEHDLEAGDVQVVAGDPEEHPNEAVAGSGNAPPAVCRSRSVFSVFAAAFTSDAAAASGCGHVGDGVPAVEEARDAPFYGTATETQSPAAAAAAGSPAAAVAARDLAAAADDNNRTPSPGGRAAAFFSFTARMRQLASAPSMSQPPQQQQSFPAASCPASPLLHGAPQAVDGLAQSQGGQDGSPGGGASECVAGAPRHVSDGGGCFSRSFSAHQQTQAAQDAAAAGGASGGGGGAAAEGGDCCSTPLPPCSPSCLFISAMARFHLDHAAEHFSSGQVVLVERLVTLLSAYAAYDPDLGYSQGMSDLALPFVLLLEDDVVAFWCFVRLMRKVRANFLPRPDGSFERLQTLGSLLTALDPPLGQHLARLGADHCHFAHRMVAAQMRRELVPELAVRLWEQLWADNLMEERAAAAAGADAAGRPERGEKSGGAAAEAKTAVEVELIELRPSSCGCRQRQEVEEEQGSGEKQEEVVTDAAASNAGSGPFCNGGMMAASAVLTAGGGDASECESETAAATVTTALDAHVELSSPSSSACMSAEQSYAVAAAAEHCVAVPSASSHGGGVLTHGSRHKALAHGTLLDRPAAASFCEGRTNRVPAVGTVGGLELELASALSCAGAETAEAVSSSASVKADEARAKAKPEGECSEARGVEIVPCSCGVADGGDAASPIRVAAAARGVAVDKPGGGRANVPRAIPPLLTFGRELFLYLVAALVLSQRRRLLECNELDDVLRVFQALSPLSRADVADALRRARELRDRVVPRPRPEAAATPETAEPAAEAASLTDGKPAAAAGATAPPASALERGWRLLRLSSDPPAAKL